MGMDYTRSLAQELGLFNINVHAHHPQGTAWRPVAHGWYEVAAPRGHHRGSQQGGGVFWPL